MKVENFMSENVFCISSDKSVRHAANLMNELRIGSLVVVDGGEIIGIVTSRDLRSAHPNRIVADAMTHNPICIPKYTFIGSAITTMEQNEVERLIVKDGDEIKGIVTRETLRSTIGKYIDPLTYLYRSKYIEYTYEYLVSENIRFHLLFIDLNDFGAVNKKFGHVVGDDLLIHFSGLLKELSNDQDYICRYGGDEFVILTSRNLDEVNALLNVLSYPVNFNNLTFSASIGFINGYDYDFNTLSYRDIISRASIISTELKQKKLS